MLINSTTYTIQPETQPTVLRTKSGKIIWSADQDTEEQNEQLGISNVQGLFLERFPEFLILYPRDVQGKILPDKEECARSFILDKIGTAVKFSKAIGGSAIQFRATPYFEGKLSVVLEKCFDPWGINFKEAEEKPVRIKDSQTGNEIVAVNFKKGTQQLALYLNGDLSAEEVLPWIVEPLEAEKRKVSHIYIGHIKGKNLYIRLNQLSENTLLQGNKLLFILRKNKYYQWLDTSSIDTANNLMSHSLKGSYRISNDESTCKIESSGWNGPSNQMFLDYAFGNNHIDPNDLMPFTVQSDSKGLIVLGTKGQTSLRLQNSEYPSESITIVPQYNREEDYCLVEIFSKKDGIPLLLFQRKIMQGSSQLLSTEKPFLKAPNGYWTPENIEQAITEVFTNHGPISIRMLAKIGKKYLVNAIYNSYPGKLTGIKAKLPHIFLQNRNDNLNSSMSAEESNIDPITLHQATAGLAALYNDSPD